MNRILIGINGPSSSGKTSISKELKKNIEDEVIIINQDMFYKNIDEKIDIKEYNFDEPSSFEMDNFIKLLKNIKNGEKKIKIPEYNYKISKRIKYNEINIEKNKIFIIDGIFLFNNKEIRDLLNIKIYIDTDLDICLIRRIERDVLERDRNIDSIIERYEKYVRYGYKKYIEPYKNYANIIIPNGKNNLEYLYKLVKILKN